MLPQALPGTDKKQVAGSRDKKEKGINHGAKKKCGKQLEAQRKPGTFSHFPFPGIEDHQSDIEILPERDCGVQCWKKMIHIPGAVRAGLSVPALSYSSKWR